MLGPLPKRVQLLLELLPGWRIGEVDYHLRVGHGLLEPLAGDGVDAAVGRGGDELVAALAQNGNGLRADQAGAADDDHLHGLPSLVDDVF
jgi:hypothetical protein